MTAVYDSDAIAPRRHRHGSRLQPCERSITFWVFRQEAKKRCGIFSQLATILINRRWCLQLLDGNECITMLGKAVPACIEEVYGKSWNKEKPTVGYKYAR